MDKARSLAAEALILSLQGERSLAMHCADEILTHCEKADVSALDCGRLFMKLAYEMALCGLNSVDIQPMLRYAAAITANTLTGSSEILITASRIRLLKGDPFGARQQLDKIKQFLPEGMALATVDAALASRFDSCHLAINRAIEEIYARQGIAPQAL